MTAGSDKLQKAVIAEVQKLSGTTLVADESQADLILEGGGELWVKGYRSLNPRSGDIAVQRDTDLCRLPFGGAAQSLR